MPKRIPVVAILASLMVIPSMVAAQASQTPEEFAVAYMDATRAADWPRVAGLMHPDALQQFKDMFAPIAEVDTTGEVLSNLFGVSSAAAYATTPPDSIYMGFMAAMMNLSPDLAGALSGSTIQPIGHIEEKATELTFIVFRMTMQAESMSISEVNVIPLKKHGGSWKAMLTGEVQGMAEALKKGLGIGM